MRCYKCGCVLSANDTCAKCGTDVSIYKKTARVSDIYYNKGLEKARVRDLSGAIETLKVSLMINKYNINARNLLGLIYCEMGEVVEALSQWVMSKNLAPDDNVAESYIKKIQSNQNKFESVTNAIKKYNVSLQYAIACAGRMFELIEEEPEIPDAPSAVSVTDIDGRVDLNNVYFSYTPDRKLIEDFTLHVKKGQKIAIVGPTGCGKTTVINLLMRFYDVNSGSIDVSGVDIRDMTRYSLRHGFGMVLQETWLKAGTIRENITMGKPDATEEEIIEAAKASYSYGFIKRLPNGFDTVIGEDGGSLSQGQKQLLCITRIMLTRPPMLILDEATSSIDTRTEIKIQNAFNKLMEGRTSFIVAHRLSTIQSADVILVMKDGHIIEKGNHEELLAAGGFYKNLYESQFDTATA